MVMGMRRFPTSQGNEVNGIYEPEDIVPIRFTCDTKGTDISSDQLKPVVTQTKTFASSEKDGSYLLHISLSMLPIMTSVGRSVALSCESYS